MLTQPFSDYIKLIIYNEIDMKRGLKLSSILILRNHPGIFRALGVRDTEDTECLVPATSGIPVHSPNRLPSPLPLLKRSPNLNPHERRLRLSGPTLFRSIQSVLSVLLAFNRGSVFTER